MEVKYGNILFREKDLGFNGLGTLYKIDIEFNYLFTVVVDNDITLKLIRISF